jgi:hypothetical protein
LSAEEKPAPTAPPPSGGGEGDRDKSSPNLDELDSAWNDDQEPFDEEATMVAKVPLDLVALSRRGNEVETKGRAAAPEKHEAITARPPPPPPGEASVVVDAPHHSLPNLESIEVRTASLHLPVQEEAEEGSQAEAHDDDDELVADDLDAGWDIEEERAVAADVAAGLDAEARREAAEARAALRKEKARAKKRAAKDKRKAHAESIRLKQKKPKKRSNPPPRDSAAAVRSSAPPAKAKAAAAPSKVREQRSDPPAEAEVAQAPARAAARRDMTRMVFFVAIVVVIGALAIGLARR